MAELVPISFERLLKRMYFEFTATNSIFDLPLRKFYFPNQSLDLSVTSCSNRAANPSGPAAGPHTQLAQNIVLSWLAGARIIELKTVQIKDQLELSRPCIDIATIGYNTEWSQELRLDESLREYVKASMMIEILQHSIHEEGFTFSAPAVHPRFNLETIFDVSVGYDLAGIQSPQIRAWLRSMQNASAIVEELRAEIPDEFVHYRSLDFKTKISDSITLSTFHGTPAEEIERICEFLLTEMKYHVVVKMNPPMLGKNRLEFLLHEKLGYKDIEVNQNVYTVNITYDDAVAMTKRLQLIASKSGRTIGVKFGNTLEVINKGSFLKEKVQYLSGQPLHVLHLTLVNEWRKSFGGDFPVSFSAGVDASNFADCVAIGLVPVTTCTDLLRPGGYGRLQQYLLNLEKKMIQLGVSTISEFILRSSSQEDGSLNEAVLSNTEQLLNRSIENSRYHSLNNAKSPRKIGSHLQLWDCINCDKCIPVCPNDANFFFDIDPVEILYNNIEISGNGWKEVEGGVFSVEEKHQIGTYADACNECGNCDIFCPEDGGPYIEKPRFFSSKDSYDKWNTLNGFFFYRENGTMKLYGRFQQNEYVLSPDDKLATAIFQTGTASTTFDLKTQKVMKAELTSSSTVETIDMKYYFTMFLLLKGIANTNRIHFVNA